MKIVLYGSPVVHKRDWLAERLGPHFEVLPLDYGASEPEKATALEGAGVLVAVRYDLTLPAAGPLKLVQVPGTGCDEVDLDRLPATATLCNVGCHEVAVAEYVILQLLEWCHRAAPADRAFRAGSWEHSSRFGATPHRELAGTTVGIVGFGAIGRALALRLQALGVTVLVANRTLPDASPTMAKAFELANITEMFEAADFGVIAVGLNPNTRGMVGERELLALGRDGVLVNIARAAVVDEAALWTCLSTGRLGGAVLDVWYNYPLDATAKTQPSSHPLLALDNVVATPHMAGWTQGTVERRWAEIAENIMRVGTGKPFLNVVRPPAPVVAQGRALR